MTESATAVRPTENIRFLIDTTKPIPRPPGVSRMWTKEERAALRRLYPEGGLAACMAALPTRSAAAIYAQTDRLGVRLKGNKVGMKKGFYSLPTTPQIDDMIRRVYQTKPERGSVVECARALGRSIYWVNARATKLGLVAPRFKEGPWSDAEVELLRTNASKTPRTISQIMQRHGFKRTEAAVVVKLKRLRIDRTDENLVTVDDLADCMGINRSSVDGWIAKGLLPTVEGGGPGIRHKRLINRSALRRFILDNVALIDIRKVDKHWFVDLIAKGRV